MQSTHMQPLTTKELAYISDSITNENLLIKQCAATAATTQNTIIQQACLTYIRNLDSHLDQLVQSLEAHQQLAPAQIQ